MPILFWVSLAASVIMLISLLLSSVYDSRVVDLENYSQAQLITKYKKRSGVCMKMTLYFGLTLFGLIILTIFFTNI